MNKDQKAEYEREKLEAELNQLRAEKAMNEMRSEARVMFKDKDIDVSDELLDIVVSDSAETTKTTLTTLQRFLMKWFKESARNITTKFTEIFQ